MESYNTWPFMTGFFHIASWFQGLSMLQHGSVLHSYKKANNIPECSIWIYYILLTHSSVDVYLCCPNKHLAPAAPSQHLLLKSPAWQLPTLGILGPQLLHQWRLLRNSSSKDGSAQREILVPDTKIKKSSPSYCNKYCRPTCWLLGLRVGLFGRWDLV